MADWYDKGYEKIIADLAAVIAVYPKHEDAATAVYALLSNEGFIDYDVEKEIFSEWFYDEE